MKTSLVFSDEYPCTVICDRYGGLFSGAKWTAWRLDSDEIPLGIESCNVMCAEFWDDFSGICGKGDTPNEAVEHLVRQRR
jgi:hypothetical protein